MCSAPCAVDRSLNNSSSQSYQGRGGRAMDMYNDNSEYEGGLDSYVN